MTVRDLTYTEENIRFEVIDEKGRQYVVYNADLTFSVQDDARTLKIFVKKHKENT